jgi:hypothetical protein
MSFTCCGWRNRLLPPHHEGGNNRGIPSVKRFSALIQYATAHEHAKSPPPGNNRWHVTFYSIQIKLILIFKKLNATTLAQIIHQHGIFFKEIKTNLHKTINSKFQENCCARIFIISQNDGHRPPPAGTRRTQRKQTRRFNRQFYYS